MAPKMPHLRFTVFFWFGGGVWGGGGDFGTVATKKKPGTVKGIIFEKRTANVAIF
jgi:hypothetical protein